MSVEQLVDSLLYEGYALYPYTPGRPRTRRRPRIGIVYPPAYAERNPAAETRCGSRSSSSTAAEASVSGSVRFLQASGERHQGVERTIELPPVAVGELAEEPVGGPFEFDGERRIQGRVRMRAEPLAEGVARVKLCVHNTTELEGDGRRSTGRRCSRA